MRTELIKKIEDKYYQKGRDKFRSGDTIKVYSKIEEGGKTRTQIFTGVVIATKNSGIRQTFTVRKISHGIGVERIFPTHSPNVERIELVKKGRSRKSKLYYLRGLIGKKALRVRAGKDITDADIYIPEEGEVIEETVTEDTPEEVTAEVSSESSNKGEKDKSVETVETEKADEEKKTSTDQAVAEEVPAEDAKKENIKEEKVEEKKVEEVEKAEAK